MDSGDAAGGAPPGRGSSAKRGRGVMAAKDSDGGGGMEVVPWGSPPPGQQQQQQLQLQPPGSASRICRVRATGGKDRHSKVYTSKGIRDRRVRLSVPTAIQFYDLQDRLGFDQPSKAVEWLLNAASAAIDDLPSLDPAAFADMPRDHHTAPRAGKQQQQQQGSRSLCSSTSETSKGSELSLSRSDGRVGGGGSSRDKEVTVASNPSATAQAGSFTELLTGAGSVGAPQQRQRWQQPVSAVAANCVGIAHPGKGGAQVVPTYAGFRFSNALPLGMVPAQPFTFSNSAAHFSLVQDGLAAAPSPTLLDFSMSSGFLGARGPLQSNSPHFSSSSHHQQLQHLEHGPSPPFLYEDAAATATHPTPESSLTASAAMQLWFRAGMKEKN